MAERLDIFLYRVIDAAWFSEILIVVLAWTMLCHGLRWEKGVWLRRLAQSALLYIALALMKIGLIVVVGWNTRVYGTILQGLICALFLIKCSSYRRSTGFLIFCSMYAGVTALLVIAGQMSFLAGDFIGKGAPEAVARCLVYLLMLPLALYLRRFNFDAYEKVPRSGMLLILAGDVSILALHIVESMWAGQDYRITVTLAGGYTCMLVMVIAAIYAMYTMCAEQAEIISLQAERQRLVTERESLKMMESNLEDLRCLRHDLKNQYAYMQILLKEKRYGELDAYFRQVAENLPPQLNYVDCGNRTMNTILNMEISKARSHQIDVTHQLVVPPVLPFPEDDLCAVVANLMDNAIEECKRLTAQVGKKPTIHLAIYPQKSYLLIVCRNATTRQRLERRGWGLRTTKGDEKLHGYGTKIVAKTAEKYNGCAEYTIDDGCFVAKVMLDMMEGSDHANQDRPV